jgi:glycosyltransferase involved in cell wall biosynthesis
MRNIDKRKGKLYLRGIGAYRNELEKVVEECMLQDKVFFLEPVDTKQLSDVAADFDVGLTMVKMNVLNHKFAVGFKTLENINAGLAIIAPNSYNLKPMMDKYMFGILYDDADISELTRVMKYCTEHLEWLDERKKISQYCANNIVGRKFQEEKLLKIISFLVSTL